MTTTDKFECRLHPTTGRLSCRVITSYRPTRGGWQRGSGPEEWDEEPAVRSHQESVRRATRRVTELVHDYDLRSLWTLTYADEPANYREVTDSIKSFSRAARANGLTLPRLLVPEWDEDLRWHLHLATPDVYMSKWLLEQRVWRRGTVGLPNIEEVQAQSALGKISIYLTKGFESTPHGQRRYIPSRGLRPLTQVYTASDSAMALAEAEARMGRPSRFATWRKGHLLAFYTGDDRAST